MFFPLRFIPPSLGYEATLCFGLEQPTSSAQPVSLRLGLCDPLASSPQPALLRSFRAVPQPLPQGPSTRFLSSDGAEAAQGPPGFPPGN